MPTPFPGRRPEAAPDPGVPAWDRRDTLPAALTSFVGREREVAELGPLLTVNRLVTLLGAPGVGKTRLALRVAEKVRGQFRDGIWLVELAPLAAPALVPQAVATSFGIREEPGRPLLQILLAALRSRRLLLVLDNCEHLIGACAALAVEILRSCPDLRILATSREVLSVPGEATWRVPSLSVPDLDPPPSPEQLIEHASARLFVDRARLAVSTFEVTTEIASAVAQICRRLDGIPLALEMAAARVRALSVEQIALRLDDRFRLLTGGSRAMLPRQQTLRALVDWSHDLLSVQEQALLRRLAIFAGGWTLEAAEAVCAFDGAGAPVLAREDVLDLLAGLVDKSLVVTELDENGEMRYSLLETLTAYGRERLIAAAESDAAANRHAAFFLALAEGAEPELYGPHQAAWSKQLHREHDNLRAALRWYVERDAVEALRMARALWKFWHQQLLWTEGRDWVERVLALPAAATPTALRAAVLQGAGMLAGFQRDFQAALPWLEESSALAERCGDALVHGRSVAFVGLISAFSGNGSAAGASFTRALALMRDNGDRWGQGRMLHWLGAGALQRGDFAAATSFLEEGLAQAEAIEDPWSAAVTLNTMGDLARSQGDDVLAQARYEETLRQLGAADDPGRTAASVLHNLGYVVLRRGDARRAGAHFVEALTSHRRTGNQPGQAECLSGLAGVLAGQAQAERAARLFGAAEAATEALGGTIWPSNRADYDRNVGIARAALDEAAFATAWAAGRSLSLEQAISEVLAAFEAQPDAGSAGAEAEIDGLAARLSPREREVAALVGRGLTSRQVAERLVVSQRTAEWHVANMLAKLGLETKAQLTAWAARAGIGAEQS